MLKVLIGVVVQTYNLSGWVVKASGGGVSRSQLHSEFQSSLNYLKEGGGGKEAEREEGGREETLNESRNLKLNIPNVQVLNENHLSYKS